MLYATVFVMRVLSIKRNLNLFQRFVDLAEIPQRLLADTEDALHIDAVHSALTGTEGNGIPADVVMPANGNSAYCHIRQVIILRDNLQDRFEFLYIEQAERCIGVFYPYMEHQPNNETQSLGHKYTTCTVLSAAACANLEIEVLTVFPHLPKLFRQGLTVVAPWSIA